jgi:transcriptional regulator with XRE-family HTH domain
MVTKRLGAMLKRTRERRGLSQVELCKRARVSQAYLSRLEAGEKRNPGIQILQRLAKALGVPVTELLG